jgi:hypothetical protein
MQQPMQQYPLAAGYDFHISMQGKTLIWKVLAPLSAGVITEKPKGATQFSAASRFRLLKILNTIDFVEASPTWFVTLTYPDWPKAPVAKETNIHRYVINRYIEKYLGEKVSIIWRLEWMPRQTGKNVGLYMPHFHLMIFRANHLDELHVAESWQKTLGVEEYLQTKVIKMVNERQVGYYVAKYCAKVEDGILDIAAYLNKPKGRHWGLMRPKLLPVHQEVIIKAEWSPRVAKALERARQIRYNGAPYEGSFTLLGDQAIEVMELLQGKGS